MCDSVDFSSIQDLISHFERSKKAVLYPVRNADGVIPGYQTKDFYMAQTEYRMRCHDINEEFHLALALHFNVGRHPKEQLLWELSWDRGHSSGLSEVAYEYAELVQLLADEKINQESK